MSLADFNRAPFSLFHRTRFSLAVLALAAGCLASLPHRAAADTTVTTTILEGTPAGDAITGAYEPADSNGWNWRWVTDAGRRDVGQSFTSPRDFEMGHIALRINSGSQPQVSQAKFTLSIRRFNDPKNPTPGEVIAMYVGELPPNEDGKTYRKDRWLLLSFPEVRIQAKWTYGFVLSFAAMGQPGQSVVFTTTSKDIYPGGTGVFSSNGEAWTSQLDFDFAVFPAGTQIGVTPVTTQTGGTGTLLVDRRGNAPFKSIAEATRAVRPGDTIKLAPGSGPYREEVYIPISGTSESPITFDGGGNLITGFDPLDQWTQQAEGWTAKLPVPFPCVITYKGERLVQNQITGQFTKYARLTPTKDAIVLLPGVEPEGWEVSTRAFVVRVFDTSFQNYKNIRASGSTNDGFNLHGRGVGLNFENIEGFHNLDEGYSAHDSMNSTIRNARFWGNDNGISNIGTSVTVADNIDCYDNLGMGLWLSDCSMEMKHTRLWGNGVAQISLRNAQANCDEVTVYRPGFTTRPWVSYMESRADRMTAPFVNTGGTLLGSLSISDANAPDLNTKVVQATE